MLNAVLTTCKPPEWEVASYTYARYHLFDLQQGDEEYASEVEPFESGQIRPKVSSLQRVQNPYQLGSFITRREQLRSRNEAANIVKLYHPIHSTDKEIALEFNMDIRRYTHRPSGNNDGKNPLFYQTPSLAFNAINVPDKVIIICNVLASSQSGANKLQKYNSAEYMPIYIAHVS